MNAKEFLEIIIIPLTLALIALSWPEIQNRSRRRRFTNLIRRELQELSPYPQQACLEGWWQHCAKRFIHREIFEHPSENRDFILSLDAELVYQVAQLWQSLEQHNWDQWRYCLEMLQQQLASGEEIANNLQLPLDAGDKMTKNLQQWQTLYEAYQAAEKDT